MIDNIHDAARKGDLEKVMTLLKNNPNLFSARISGGETPLHFAAYDGHKDVVVLLLANKADVNAKAGDGITPLLVAKRNGRKKVVELLRRHGGKE